MTNARADWLVRSLHLTAPECYVLQFGQEADGRWAFKLTLLELIAQRVFRRIAGPGSPADSFLVPGPEFQRSLPPSMGVVREIFLAQDRKEVPGTSELGLSIIDLTHAAQRRFMSVGGFISDAVMPTLIGRGYFVKEEYKILFIIPARRFVLTPTGQQAKYELERALMSGQRQFTQWSATEPSRALQFLGEMGSAALLLRPLYPDIQKIANLPEELRPKREPEADDAIDLLDLLRDALSMLVDDLSAVDTGVDSGVDSAGGGDADGGGGDGGGE